MRSFKMLADSKLEPKAIAGTVVYEIAGPDYGLAGDDTRGFGFPHKSVTLRSDGDYPSFTVPERDLEPLSPPQDKGGV
jgi:hypothetical protein